MPDGSRGPARPSTAALNFSNSKTSVFLAISTDLINSFTYSRANQPNRMRGKPPIARPWRSLSQLERRVERIPGDRAAMLPARGLLVLLQPRARASQSTNSASIKLVENDFTRRPRGGGRHTTSTISLVGFCVLLCLSFRSHRVEESARAPIGSPPPS